MLSGLYWETMNGQRKEKRAGRVKEGVVRNAVFDSIFNYDFILNILIYIPFQVKAGETKWKTCELKCLQTVQLVLSCTSLTKLLVSLKPAVRMLLFSCVGKAKRRCKQDLGWNRLWSSHFLSCFNQYSASLSAKETFNPVSTDLVAVCVTAWLCDCAFALCLVQPQ